MIRHVTELDQGVVILGSWPFDLPGWIFPLIIADPPYGKIINEPWDHRHELAINHAIEQLVHLRACQDILIDGGSIYWFGSQGRPNYRPFYKVCDLVEQHTDLQIAVHIRWGKKRAIGTKKTYLWTSEECLYLVNGSYKNPSTFNVPYTDEIRGYDGYNPKYPCKSKYKRRTSEWRDFAVDTDMWDYTEILRGKRGPCEKPQSLLKRIIETHTKPGDYVLDLYSDTGSTSLAARDLDRRFVAIEERAEPSDPKWLNGYHCIVDRLKS